MFPQFVTLLLLFYMSIFYFEASGDLMPSPEACLNCSKCESPCQQSPAPVSGYPSYGTPPPPAASPPPPPSGYAIYGEPPPPPPQEQGQSKCPPPPAAQCCTPTPANTFSPPNPYTYVPYNGEGENSLLLLQVLVPLLMLSSSFVFLF